MLKSLLIHIHEYTLQILYCLARAYFKYSAHYGQILQTYKTTDLAMQDHIVMVRTLLLRKQALRP